MLTLAKKEVGHGVTVERYTDGRGKRVVVLVSTSGADEAHYTVLDMDGSRSGIIYSRAAAMKLAESKAH